MTVPNRSSVLRLFGDGQGALGTVRSAGLTRLGAALSLGGARKQYGDPAANEDAVLLCETETGCFFALADGHNGAEGAHLALNWLLHNRAEYWAANGPGALDLPQVATDAFRCINHLIWCQNRDQGSSFRTTLSMGLIGSSHRDVFVASVGDSHIFAVDSESCRPVAVSPTAGSYFLGASEEPSLPVAPNCAFDTLSTSGLHAVVIASDGISSPGIGFRDPASEVFAATNAALQQGSRFGSPASLAAAIAMAACGSQRANQSGDNISVAAVTFVHPPGGERRR